MPLMHFERQACLGRPKIASAPRQMEMTVADDQALRTKALAADGKDESVALR